MNETTITNVASVAIASVFTLARAFVKAKQDNPKSSLKSVEGWLAIVSVAILQLQSLITALKGPQ